MSASASAGRGAAWDGMFPGGAPPFQQSFAYGEAAARLGSEVWRIPSGAGPVQFIGRRFGPLRLVLASRWRGDPGGISAACPARSACLVTPEAGGGAPGLTVAPPRLEAVLDLTRPAEALRAALDQKWRNRLVRAESGALRVLSQRPDAARLRHLLGRDGAQQRTRGYRTLPHAFVAAWLDAAPGAALHLVGSVRGEAVAEVLFLVHGRAATWHCGWAGAEGRAVSAHNLLLWRGFLDLRDRGVTSVNLGIADPDRTPGLARFKRGTGAAPHAVGPTRLLLPIRRRS